jgi:hypothetical protein
MPIQFACSCGRKLQASEEHVGRRVKCPACGAEMTVPAGQTAVQPAEASPSKPSPVRAEEPRRSEREDEREDDRRGRPSRRREDEDDDRRRHRRRDDDEDEEEDRPRRRRRRWEDDEDEEDDDRLRMARGTSGKATAALVLGFLSFCFGILTAIPAVILALLSFGDIGRSRGRLGGKGLAIAGLALACIGTVLSIVGYVYAVGRVREAASRMTVHNNMMQMVLSMHNYHDMYNQLPQATPDPKLKGRTKLSWRVELLPYLEQDNLYRQLRHDEPWDSPHNKALLTAMPKVFQHPLHPDENAKGLTYYRVFVGEHTPFPPGKVTRIPASFPDGTSNTILIVEAADPVPWTKPDELVYDPTKPLPKLGGHFRSGTMVALADGTVRLVGPGVSENTWRIAIDPNDGLPLPGDWW